jgi:hypothetical protein
MGTIVNGELQQFVVNGKSCICTESNVYVWKNQLTLISFVGVEIDDLHRPQLYGKWLFSNTE